MSETKCCNETRVEVRYKADEFVKSLFGECSAIAKRYVQDHPKEFYGVDDFIECYRIAELQKKARHGFANEFDDPLNGSYVGPDTWKEDDISFERAYKLYEQNGSF